MSSFSEQKNPKKTPKNKPQTHWKFILNKCTKTCDTKLIRETSKPFLKNICLVVNIFPFCHWGCVFIYSSCSLLDTSLFFVSSPNGNIRLQLLELVYLSYMYDISLCFWLADMCFTYSSLHTFSPPNSVPEDLCLCSKYCKATSYCLASGLLWFVPFYALTFSKYYIIHSAFPRVENCLSMVSDITSPVC